MQEIKVNMRMVTFIVRLEPNRIEHDEKNKINKPAVHRNGPYKAFPYWSENILISEKFS